MNLLGAPSVLKRKNAQIDRLIRIPKNITMNISWGNIDLKNLNLVIFILQPLRRTYIPQCEPF